MFKPCQSKVDITKAPCEVKKQRYSSKKTKNGKKAKKKSGKKKNGNSVIGKFALNDFSFWKSFVLVSLIRPFFAGYNL